MLPFLKKASNPPMNPEPNAEPVAPDVPVAEPNPYEPDTDQLPFEPPPVAETEVPQDPPLPLQTTPEPLRPLAAGTFLAGEFEIKDVLLRGEVNFYLADAGDYGQSTFKLVAERAAPEQPVLEGPEVSLLPAARRFVEQEREYAVWGYENLQPLEDWRAPANDETYLHVIATLAGGLAALEGAGLNPKLEWDCLYFDAASRFRYFGFLDVPGETPTSGIAMLADVSDHVMKTSLARGATLRLDDPLASLALSNEVKQFARALHTGQFPTAAEAATELEALAPVHRADLALLTDVGLERELNEDSGLIFKLSRGGHSRNVEIEVLAVADGMGGHEGGEVASDLTLTALQTAVTKRLGIDWNDNAAVRAALREILDEVNLAVVRMNEDPPYAALRNKPGSTLVCGIRLGSRLFLGNVGDSRAYRWSTTGGLERLTKDHSYVQDLIDAGRLQEEDAWGHPDSSVITSHIGMPRGAQKDVFLRLLRAGDKLALVSDGVVDTLRDLEIEAIFAEAPDANTLALRLVEAANDAGGIDNITVAAAFCS
jgi:protein phosphatase